MKAIKGILEEELTNSRAMKADYERELAKLPKGSLVGKEIKGHRYYYLQVREGGRSRFIYKGKLSDREVAGYERAKRRRAMYRGLLTEVKKQIRFLEKVLHEHKSV